MVELTVPVEWGNIITFNHLHWAGIQWRWTSTSGETLNYGVELGQGRALAVAVWILCKLLSGKSPFEWPYLGLVVASNGGPLALFNQPGGYIKVNGCPWLGPILSLENSGWCITTEVSFCQNILILVIILVVKKVKSNDRQFTGANVTWVYSFHSNFGGKFHLLLFLFFKYFKGFTEVAR